MEQGRQDRDRLQEEAVAAVAVAEWAAAAAVEETAVLQWGRRASAFARNVATGLLTREVFPALIRPARNAEP